MCDTMLQQTDSERMSEQYTYTSQCGTSPLAHSTERLSDHYATISRLFKANFDPFQVRVRHFVLIL